MTSAARRPVRAFLVTPIAGVGVFWSVFIVLGPQPVDLFFFFFFSVVVLGVMCAATWIVCLPVYLMLPPRHLRPAHFVIVYVSTGVLMVGWAAWRSPRVPWPSWMLIAGLTGAATGGVFAQLLMPAARHET